MAKVRGTSLSGYHERRVLTGEVARARHPLKIARARRVRVNKPKKIKKRRLTIPKCPIRLYSRIMQLCLCLDKRTRPIDLPGVS